MIQFLPAEPFDVAELTRISTAAFDSDAIMSGEAGGPPDYDNVEWHREMQTEEHLFKLTDGELIVGGAVLFADADKMHIGRIWIDPERFHRGLGTFMMNEIEHRFEGIKKLELDTPLWNIRTNSFYQKLGYTAVGKDDEFNYYEKFV